MNLYTMCSRIRSRFKTQIEVAQKVKVIYDNEEYERNDERDAWIRFTIATGDNNQRSMGSAPRFRQFGVSIAQVNVLAGSGDKAAWDLSDAIVAAFRAQTVESITYRSPKPTVVGRVGDEWRINVTIPFYADDIGA